MKRKKFPRPTGKQLQILAGIAAVGTLGFLAARWLTPRTVSVCVVTDYSFRDQRPNWSEFLVGRFAAANRIFRSAGVQWSFRHADQPDPTGKIDGLEERRQKLTRTECEADVILGVTGRPEGQTAGDAPAFAHTAIVVDNPKLTEEQNTRVLVQGLARLFGTPVDPKGAGTIMTQPPESDQLPKPAVKLIGRLAKFPFIKGPGGMDPEWDERIFQALSDVYQGRAGNPARAAHRAMGMALAAGESFTGAIRHLQEAVKLEPNDVAGHIELATLYTHNFQAAEAVEEYRAAVRLKPDSAQNHAGLAVALANQGKGEQAIEEFRAALAIQPTFAAAQAGLAYILSQQLGRIDESIAAYQVAVQMNPELPAATQGLERARGFKEKSVTAAADQRQRVQRLSSSSAAYFDLGLAEARAGNVDLAVKAFRRALELDGRNGRAHANLAMLLYLQKDYAAALREARTATEAGFDPPPALMELLKQKTAQ